MNTFARRFLLWAVGYVLLAVTLGFYMALTVEFILQAVHAHLALVGWVSMALFAFYYNAVPEAIKGRLPLIHFWSAQFGLICMAPGLAGVLHDNMEWDPMLGVGQVLTAFSFLIFFYTVWKHPPKPLTQA